MKHFLVLLIRNRHEIKNRYRYSRIVVKVVTKLFEHGTSNQSFRPCKGNDTNSNDGTRLFRRSTVH